jgi:hypothetical protein
LTATVRGTVRFEVYDCQCQACTDLSRDYGRDDFATIPAGPVRWHISKLLDAGHTTSSIAVAAGVTQRTINHIRAQRIRMTKRSTADRILSVRVDEPPSEKPHTVPSTRVQPLIEELRSRGWSYARINHASGCSNTWKSVNASRHVHHLTWRRITTMYELLARQGLVDSSLLECVHDG